MRHTKSGLILGSIALVGFTLSACSTLPQRKPAPVTAVTIDRPMLGTTEDIPAEPVRPMVTASARPIQMQPSAPQTYVVRKGDTLWDISTRFLKTPWRWPEIWRGNPDIKNPDLIYPGDVIRLYYINGKPQLTVNRTMSGSNGKLSPRVRESSLEKSDSGIAIRAIRPFLIHPEIVSEEMLRGAPHIVASQDEHLIYGENNRVYVRDLPDDSLGSRYSVFRPGDTFLDPVTNEVLGFEAMHTSDAEVVRRGNPATVILLDTVREVLRGDRLLAAKPRPDDYYFVPHSPPLDAKGEIISVFDSLNQIAGYQIAVINVGKRNRVEPGHVFAINQRSRLIEDRHHSKTQTEEVALPEERSGLIMVFKSFEKLSYGLIMEASRPIRVADTVASP